jgi:hypothetical protein
MARPPHTSLRRRAWLILLMVLSAGCSARLGYATRTMPNPDGCYVQVWDRPGFTGSSDFINGPFQHRHLRDLAGRRSWDDRIRSMAPGPSTSAVAWSGEDFSGRSLVVTADRGPLAAVPVDIQSLDIRCAVRAAR